MKNKTSFKKGHKGLWLGKKMSDEHRKKMSDSAKKGKENSQWKGDDASYFAKHIWLKTHFGKACKCENINCKYPKKVGKRILIKPKAFQWAKKINSEYTRYKKDYYQLCASCHKLYDLGKINI